MMNKKVDFFMAKRELSDHVVSFMTSKIWRKEINLRYADLIQIQQNHLDAEKKYAGALNSFPLTTEERQRILDNIHDLEKSRDEELSKFSFSLSEADKTLKKALSGEKTPAQIYSAVCAWFKSYGLDVDGTTFISDVIKTFGDKFDMKTLVNSKDNKCLKLDVTRALQNVYCSCYTAMCNAGTIKPAQIPDIVRDKYVKKDKKKDKNVVPTAREHKPETPEIVKISKEYNKK